MIRRCWEPPNFRCEVEDLDGHVDIFLLHAESKEALETRLKARQLKILEMQEYDFAQWRKRARAARKKAIADHKAGKRPIKFDDKLWRELKMHLFDLFYGKCAYCEWKPLAGSSGDVEHYRPKHKVDEDPNHPGYYWLAYSPSNLLPSCEHCNRTRGKMTHFPVAGFRATRPWDLRKEEPLLLYPYGRQPALEPLQHLDFNEHGAVGGTTEIGQNSCKFYHLNRGGIIEERCQALKTVEQDWDVATLKKGFAEGYMGLRNELRMGTRVYSAAQIAQLNRLKQQRLKLLESED